MIKRLIFDIDGTLITGVSFDEAIKNLLLEQGFFSEENKQKFIYAISTYENNHSEYEPKQYLQYFSQVLGLGDPKWNIGIREIRENERITREVEKMKFWNIAEETKEKKAKQREEELMARFRRSE